MSHDQRWSRSSSQIADLSSLLTTSDCVLKISTEKWPSTHHLQLLRKELRNAGATLFCGKKSFVRVAGKQVFSEPKNETNLKHILALSNQPDALVFVANENDIHEVFHIIGSVEAKMEPKIGMVAPTDVHIKAGITTLSPTQTGGLRAYNIASKITRGKIEFLSNVLIRKAGEKFNAQIVKLCRGAGVLLVFKLQVLDAVNLRDQFIYPKEFIDCDLNRISKSLCSAANSIRAVQTMITEAPDPEAPSSERIVQFFDCPVISRFQTIRNHSLCPFAKAAVLWGNVSQWDSSLSVEENAKILSVDVQEFLLSIMEHNLDAFVIEIPDANIYAPDIPTFERITHLLLSSIGKILHNGLGQTASVGYYNLGAHSCFATFFAPCYPKSHSRYMYEENQSSCFVMIQPEQSFIKRKIIDPANRLQFSNEDPAICRKIRSKFTAHDMAYISV